MNSNNNIYQTPMPTKRTSTRTFGTSVVNRNRQSSFNILNEHPQTQIKSRIRTENNFNFNFSQSEIRMNTNSNQKRLKLRNSDFHQQSIIEYNDESENECELSCPLNSEWNPTVSKEYLSFIEDVFQTIVDYKWYSPSKTVFYDEYKIMEEEINVTFDELEIPVIFSESESEKTDDELSVNSFDFEEELVSETADAMIIDFDVDDESYASYMARHVDHLQLEEDEEYENELKLE